MGGDCFRQELGKKEEMYVTKGSFVKLVLTNEVYFGKRVDRRLIIDRLILSEKQE